MKKKNKILVLGYFGYANNQLDGQTVKTRNVYDLLKRHHLGVVKKYDTFDYRQNPLSLVYLFSNLVTSNAVVIIPCLNNLTYLFPIVYFLSKIFRFKIIHIGVGGWQLEYFKGNERFKPHKLHLNLSKKIKVIMPEINSVTESLKTELNFKNVETFPNFRFFNQDTISNRNIVTEKLKLVFMARINKKKGYDTVFEFMNFAKRDKLNVEVSFYGPIEDLDKDDFLRKVDADKEYINYGGVLEADDIYSKLSTCDLLLLPTQFFTEGFPGSVLDAYIAGVPVIVTRWKHATEFVDDGETGFIVPFENPQQEFNEKILLLYHDRVRLSEMKQNAKIKSYNYSSEYAWQILQKYL